MNGVYSVGLETPRRRRRKTSLPAPLLAIDYLLLIGLLLIPVAGIWVFGGNRFWIMGPMIWLTLVWSGVFVYRFFLSRYRYDFAVPPGGIVGGVLLAYLVAILAWAEVPYQARLETFRFLSYGAAFWLWVNLLRFNHRWKWALALLMLSVSAMAWYAMIQQAHGSNWVLDVVRPAQYGMRASGAYICPNHFAHLLVMLITFSLGLIFSRGVGIPIKLFAGYTVLAGLPPLYLAESRSGWLGLLFGITVFVIFNAMKKGVRRLLLVILLAPMVTASTGWLIWKLSPRVQARVEAALEGDIRIPMWKDTWEIAQHSPWIGTGLGSYRHLFPHYRNHLTGFIDPEFAHNDYLHFLVEIGRVGLALLLLWLGVIALRSIRVLRADQQAFSAPLMSGLLAMMAGSLVHAFFDFNFHIFANAHVFLFLIAVGFCAANDRENMTIMKSTGAHFRVIGVGCLLALAGLTWMYSRMLVSYYYEVSGDARVMVSDWDNAQADYRKAMKWSPDNWRAHIGYAHLLRARSFWMRNPALREPWIDEAVRHYEIVEKLNPWEAEVWYGLGSLYKMRGDEEAALAMHQKTVEQVPRHVFYLNTLGFQLRDMGRHEEALAAFMASREAEPNILADRNIALLQRKLQEKK